MRVLFAVALSVLVAPGMRAQTLSITASPQSAGIYRLKQQDNSLMLLGTGTAQFKLQDNDPNTVVVRLDGYRDVTQTFVKGTKFKDKAFLIALTRRIVKITALPYDATILVNGEAKGQRNLELEVQEGQTMTVELKKTGYAPVKRTYRHEKGTELPPASDRLELTDRLVAISAGPTGVAIFRDDAKVGDGDADVIVPRGSCVTVRAQKTGWISAERSYCNKDGLTDPPIQDRLVLAGRVVNVNAPPDAKIFVNQRQAGMGTFAVRINEGTCASVRIEQGGFLPVSREYCAQDNAPAPPMDDAIALKPDDSFAASVQSDQANVNVTIEVGKGRTEEQAWRLISSIVLSHFDVLENSDSQTGYLRTAWQIKSYGDGAVVIRTRVIVKWSGLEPLRYTVKIVSERNRLPGVTVKEDENFVPWERVLSTYKDVIPEMQSRLQ